METSDLELIITRKISVLHVLQPDCRGWFSKHLDVNWFKDVGTPDFLISGQTKLHENHVLLL